MGYFKNLLVEADELKLPMTLEEAAQSMRRSFNSIAGDLFVDDEGKFDESITFTGEDLQGMIPDYWIDVDRKNFAFFNILLSNKKFFPIWDAVKSMAFPDKEIFGV